MGDPQVYIATRKEQDPESANNFDTGYQDFKIGIMLKMAEEFVGWADDRRSPVSEV